MEYADLEGLWQEHAPQKWEHHDLWVRKWAELPSARQVAGIVIRRSWSSLTEYRKGFILSEKFDALVGFVQATKDALSIRSLV